MQAIHSSRNDGIEESEDKSHRHGNPICYNVTFHGNGVRVVKNVFRRKKLLVEAFGGYNVSERIQDQCLRLLLTLG